MAERETWQAPDGTIWFYSPRWKEWTGWMPGEDGHWQLATEEFRRSYPSAPPWDKHGRGASSGGSCG